MTTNDNNSTVMPSTLEELWDVSFIASDGVEAERQAVRQHKPFHGATITVPTIAGFFPGSDDFDIVDLETPVAVIVGDLSVVDGWDGEVLYPYWHVRAVIPAEEVTTSDGRTVTLDDIGCCMYGAPGIGTAAGARHRDRQLLIAAIVA